MIPQYSPKADVLVAVPGTAQAKEARIANQIPQTATISRTAAHITVKYDGAPDFKPIQGTSLTYAVNSRTPIIYEPGGSYYACQTAVWFMSSTPNGPWTVATSVPVSIYTIPAGSSLHYVTYVKIYGYTPTSVYAGYTPGYYGTVLSTDGVVVYGTGYSYPPYIGSTLWVPPPYTYGVGAAFSWSAAEGWALGFGLGFDGGSAEPMVGAGRVLGLGRLWRRPGAGAATAASLRRISTDTGATPHSPARAPRGRIQLPATSVQAHEDVSITRSPGPAA